jgi:general secretion pathway protein M
MKALAALSSPDLKQGWKPALAFAGVLLALIVAGIVAWVSVADGIGALNESLRGRAQIESRLGKGGPNFSVQPSAASPFLEGASATLAGAALQQRVADVIVKAGGVALSSQLEISGPRAAQGYIGLIVSCDLGQDGLQKTLYDLESGFPVLFVDQLVVQTGVSDDANRKGQMRVQIGVYGRWEAPK